MSFVYAIQYFMLSTSYSKYRQQRRECAIVWFQFRDCSQEVTLKKRYDSAIKENFIGECERYGACGLWLWFDERGCRYRHCDGVHNTNQSRHWDVEVDLNTAGVGVRPCNHTVEGAQLPHQQGGIECCVKAWGSDLALTV